MPIRKGSIKSVMAEPLIKDEIEVYLLIFNMSMLYYRMKKSEE